MELPVGAGRARLLLVELIALGDDDDTALRDGEALGVSGRIEANPLVGWDPDVFVNDALPELRSLANLCPVEQERILDYGSLLDPDVRKENGVADSPADDECSRCEHAVDDLGFTA